MRYSKPYHVSEPDGVKPVTLSMYRCNRALKFIELTDLPDRMLGTLTMSPMTQAGQLRIGEDRSPSKAQSAVPTELPGNPAICDESNNLSTKAALDDRSPRHERELLGVFDQRVAARSKLHRLAIDAADRLASRRQPERLVPRCGNLRANSRQLSAFERCQQISPVEHPSLPVPARIAVRNVMLPALLQRRFNFRAEAGHGNRQAVPADELAIQPDGTVAGDLRLKVKRR